jgi:murein DD-endopeptidase MepM/ murein hydrolase activator NlpD
MNLSLSSTPGYRRRRRGRRARHRYVPVRDVVRAASRGITRRVLSSAAFGLVSLMILAATFPLAGSSGAQAADTALPLQMQVEGQAMAVETHDLDAVGGRDGYSISSRAELLRQQYTLTYTTSWTGPIRWPFPEPVRISDGFGYRPAPCGGCSTYHTAVDFDPGAGVPIYAIADGVVREHVDGRGSWGNYVVIEHQINGQIVVSSYAHMQRGTSPLEAGQTIKVGDYIGLVGATGQVTGAHLHLEIAVNGASVDPYEWLRANAG